MNPLKQLQTFGQSIWLDFIRRGMLHDGTLEAFITRDGISGMTSNPSIFEQAIAQSNDYTEAIAALVRAGYNADAIYQTLTVEDVQRAADIFGSVYQETQRRDGYVSLEVDPRLAYDTPGTVEDARRLWAALDRPNVMIKVPATREGLPAIRTLLTEGVNVNVTLLFSVTRYRAVAEAYLEALEARQAQGLPLDGIASVASFFVSRIDTLLDALLDQHPCADARALKGRIAVASAKAAYAVYQEIFHSERFRALEAHGARPQRLLWASTSTKNPAYSDVKYIEALIGPETVSTVPLKTLDAYRDHGRPAERLTQGIPEAQATLAQLAELQIDLEAAMQQLEEEGVQKFIKAFESLMHTLQEAAVRA